MRCVAAVIVYFHSSSLSETQIGSPAKLSPVGQGLAGRHSVVIYCIWYIVLFCLNINSGDGLFASVLEMFETWSTSSELMVNPQSQKIIYTRIYAHNEIFLYETGKKKRKFWFSCHGWFQWFRFKSKHRLTSWTLVSVEFMLLYTKNKMHSIILRPHCTASRSFTEKT